MKNKLWIFVMALGLIAAGAGTPTGAIADSATSQGAAEAVVKIDNFSFSPATLTDCRGHNGAVEQC